MYRRHFVQNVAWGLSAIYLPLLLNGCKKELEPKKKVEEVPVEPASWMEQLLGENDLAVSQLIEKQMDNALDQNYGGIPDAYEIFHPGGAAGLIQRLATSYVSKDSAYYHLDHVVVRMEHSIEFLLKRQHEDGTVDLLTTNFHSTPDTGFVVEPLALSYKLLQRDGQSATVSLRESMRDFLTRAGEALKVGGIHTPNHRWVVSMAMARLYELFEDKGYLVRINRWLREGIDIDADGQYTERSTAVYSPLTDRCFITMARILERPELFDPVKRNLDMTLYYLHPNGEIATEASRRQDQYLARQPVAYYYPYRFMSIQESNPEFGAVVKLLEDNLGASGLSGYLPYLLEDPMVAGDYPFGSIPNHYERFFKDSDLVRYRRDTYDATILAKNSALFTFHNDGAVLQAVRMASAFFGKGQFIADSIEKVEDKYVLKQHLEGPYYQPIAKGLIAADGNWEAMPKEKRPQSEVQKMDYLLEINEIDQGFQLDFTAEGTDNVPVAIELSFRKGGDINGAEAIEDESDIYLLVEEIIVYSVDDVAIEVTGGDKMHRWTQLRGAEPRIDGVSVYLTGFTPFHQKLIIKATKE